MKDIFPELLKAKDNRSIELKLDFSILRDFLCLIDLVQLHHCTRNAISIKTFLINHKINFHPYEFISHKIFRCGKLLKIGRKIELNFNEHFVVEIAGNRGNKFEILFENFE